MTHLYSRGVEYAIRCLRLLAMNPALPRTVMDLCEEAKLPEHFTRKMLQPLVRQGILKSHRGPGGGFVFARPPAEISLRMVVEGIEGGPRTDYCLLGEPECSAEKPCPLHHQWKQICDLSNQLLDQTTILDLTKGWDGRDSLNGLQLGGDTEQEDSAPAATTGRRFLPRN